MPSRRPASKAFEFSFTEIITAPKLVSFILYLFLLFSFNVSTENPTLGKFFILGMNQLILKILKIKKQYVLLALEILKTFLAY